MAVWLSGGVFIVDFLLLSALSSPRTLLSLKSLLSLLSSRHQKRNLEHFAARQKWRVTCRFFADFWRLNAELFRSRGRHRWRENIFRSKKLNFSSNFSTFVDWKVKYNFTTPQKGVNRNDLQRARDKFTKRGEIGIDKAIFAINKATNTEHSEPM